MDRWTKKQLSDTSDIDFAVCILNERRAKVSPYSPLGVKLSETVCTLRTLRDQAEASKEPQTADDSAGLLKVFIVDGIVEGVYADEKVRTFAPSVEVVDFDRNTGDSDLLDAAYCGVNEYDRYCVNRCQDKRYDERDNV